VFEVVDLKEKKGREVTRGFEGFLPGKLPKNGPESQGHKTGPPNFP